MDKPGHVLMTADAVGGVWTYAVDLARELAGSGVRTTVAVLGPAPSHDQRNQAEAAGARLVVLGGALDWTAEAPAEVDASGLRLAALANRIDADIVHVNGPAVLANVRLRAPVVAACHSCVKTWWAAVKGEGGLPPDLRWRADMTGRAYRSADALVAPTRAFARATQAAYGLAAPPRVIRNGRASPTSPAQPPPGRLVFTAGRLWDEGKDIATLDRASARLGIDVIAAGALTGPNGATIAFEHLGATGPLSDETLQSYLSLRPIFVSTSLYEPFGLAVLEAAQAGCALVLSDIASFRELWHGAAVFFRPGDDTALAAAIRAVADDEVRRSGLGEAARGRAGRYSARLMEAGMLAVYGELLSARQAAKASA